MGAPSLKSIAKAYDITHTLLMLWVDKYRRRELTDEFDHVESSGEAEVKIAALEHKVEQLTMELNVLKNHARAGALTSGRERASILTHCCMSFLAAMKPAHCARVPCNTYHSKPFFP